MRVARWLTSGRWNRIVGSNTGLALFPFCVGGTRYRGSAVTDDQAPVPERPRAATLGQRAARPAGNGSWGLPSHRGVHFRPEGGADIGALQRLRRLIRQEMEESEGVGEPAHGTGGAERVEVHA